MSRSVYTHNNFHLGDNLIFLHLLRSLAKSHVSTAFVHFCHAHYHNQLKEVVEDLPNILLESFESPLWEKHQRRSIDSWKNADGHWEKSKVRWNWSEHALEHHRWTARRMGFESPFTCREHLLFDYPSLNAGVFQDSGILGEFLIVNCEPNSGQFSPMAEHGSGYLNNFIDALVVKWGSPDVQTVNVKRPAGWIGENTISHIGNFSRCFRNHIMIATGPMWPTLNVHNHHNSEGRKRIVLLDNNEQLNMPGITQCSRVEEVFAIARQEGWV